MASMSADRDGNRIVQFKNGQGRRKTIRLGKRSEKSAEKIRTKIEALIDDTIRHKAHSVDVASWVRRTERNEPDLYDKLASAGLVPARESKGQITLAVFCDRYIAGRNGDVKWGTGITYRNVRRNLVDFFGADRLMDSITSAEAKDWRRWLVRAKDEVDLKAGGAGLSENTARRRCGTARQFFADAVERRIIVENPFAGIKGVAVRENRARDYFVTRKEADAVLKACPDVQWQLLFSLSRYGGLRCPSEHLALTWADVDFDAGRIRVRSAKTEHHEGKGERTMPLFPELRPYLEAVRSELDLQCDSPEKPLAEQPVISRYRDANANLRTQLCKIIRRAKLKPWPKLFQNLRATRATELADEFPSKVAADWLGHSVRIADKHYRQTTDEHFARALGSSSLKSAQEENAAPALHRVAVSPVSNRTGSQCPSKSSGNCNGVRPGATQSGRHWTRTSDLCRVNSICAESRFSVFSEFRSHSTRCWGVCKS
jgi:integrase